MKTIVKPWKLVASSASRFFNCPAHIHLVRRLGTPIPEEQSEAASLGSRVHEIGEKGIKHWLETGKVNVVNFLSPNGFDTHTEQGVWARDTALFYIDFFRDTYQKHEALGGKTKAIIEKKYRIKTVEFEYVAKADAMIVTRKKDTIFLTIMDLKTGRWDYTESTAKQLWFTALVYILQNPKLKLFNFRINTYVIQPNFWSEAGRAVRLLHEKFTHKDIRIAATKLRESIVYGENAFTVGEHCKWCPALIACPSVADTIQKIIAAKPFPVEKLTPEWLTFVWRHHKMIEDYIQAVNKTIKYQIRSGVHFDYLSLGTRKGYRQWVSPELVEERLEFLGEDRYEERKLKTPAQMEALAGKENIKGLFEQKDLPVIKIQKCEFDEVEE